MENAKYTDLIGRHLSGSLTAQERAELMAWVEADGANRAFFDEMVRLWRVSSEYEEAPFPADTEKSWAAFEKKFERRFPAAAGSSLPQEGRGAGRVARLRPLRIALRYAAAMALLLAAGYWLFFTDSNGEPLITSIRTEAGEQQELSLPDGSTVVLNERSELRYAESFAERRVQLSGEAFFQVAKRNGERFTIEAEGTTTTVLGTSFNVRAYPAETRVEVSVKTGKVALQKANDNQQQALLEAGEAGAYDKQQQVVEETLISNADAWKTSRLDFDGIPLNAVVDALERYFQVRIEVSGPGLEKCSFKGAFVKPELQDVLDALSFTMMLKVEKQNGAYVLSGDASACE